MGWLIVIYGTFCKGHNESGIVHTNNSEQKLFWLLVFGVQQFPLQT